MNKPLLLIVTGRPASGKSTLASILAKEIKIPLISRDALKEGYINTVGLRHDQLDQSASLHIYHAFFKIIGLFVSQGISIIAEAAFQDHLWKPQLLQLMNQAEIRILLCNIPPELAKKRFVDRLLNNPERDKFHGDNSTTENAGLQTETYSPPNMDLPTLLIDTTAQYRPGIQEIINFVSNK